MLTLLRYIQEQIRKLFKLLSFLGDVEIQVEPITGLGKRITFFENGQQIARAFVYFLHNDLHDTPFALLEDVFVEEQFRSHGYGEKIVRAAIDEAKKAGCYKIICTSRYQRENVHHFYEKLGFTDYGKEFRVDL
ncbi:GNAT family N-acetyltransferase [Candidatus Woesearchaeota archaeon]|nr:GNAT family N-acetyltransferase [Candidatus Woesearchaeota archaeon]